MRKKIGDIIEIQTEKGFAYGQYTYEAPNNFGSVVRIFQGLYQDKPNADDIVEFPLRFTILFPLGAALHRKLVNRLDNKPVRIDLQGLPIFRCRLLKYMLDPTRKVEEWGLWDGNDAGTISNDSPKCKSMPLVRSWSIPDLVERLESDNNDEIYDYINM